MNNARASNDINYSIANPLNYHKYGCYWNSKNTTHYLDEKPIQNTERKTQPTAMLSNMFMMFTCAKGQWYTYTLPPSTYEVDYFKVWRL
jgi:hypothetical protein